MLRRRAAALLGLAVLAAGGATEGCAATNTAKSVAATRATHATRRPQPPPAVSAAESLRVLDGYVARYNTAVSHGDGRAWRRLLADPLATLADARLRMDHGRPPDRRRVTLVNPVLLVPRLDGYPTWFVAAAMERLGPRGRPRPVLLLFTRSGPNASWLLANRTVTTAKLPKPAIDGQGYAIAVDPQATPAGRLAVPVDRLPSAHAAYLTAGTGHARPSGRPSGAAFAAGPYTTGWLAGLAAQAGRLRARGGWQEATTFAQSRYPPVALRTKDGGVLAWYAVSRVDSLLTARLGRTPDPAALSADVRGYLGQPSPGARTEVRAARLLLPVTYVPPQGHGQARVLGQTEALTSAVAIQH